MGGTKRIPRARLKTAPELAAHLIQSCPALKQYQSYMFGSSLRGVISDYDLLMVGPAGSPLVDLKAQLRVAGEELPLDILYMLPDEATETDFIAREGCVSLTELAKRQSNLHA